MTDHIDIAAIRSAARAAMEGPWVAPISSPLDVVLPAAYRDKLAVTVVTAKTRTEAQFITAFDPLTTLELLERKVPRPALELLREHAHGSTAGIRSSRRVSADCYEVSIGSTVVATTDSADIATFLAQMNSETVLAILDRAGRDL